MKEYPSEDNAETSRAMMRGMPSILIKDALMIGNTSASPRRCFIDDFYGGRGCAVVRVGFYWKLAMQMCLCCSWDDVFTSKPWIPLVIDAETGGHESSSVAL